MAEDWRKVGAVVNQVSIPAALVSDAEYRSTFPFAGLSGYPIRYYEWESWRFSCATAARADGRWRGHRDGYCSAAAEPIIERLQSALDPGERTQLQAEVMRIVLKQDMAGPPIFWQVAPSIFAKGITGIKPIKLGPNAGSLRSTSSIHLWDRTL
jgi:ABC-type transport system substrate-binding protein